MKKFASIAFMAVSLLFCFLVGVSALFSEADVSVEQRDATPFPAFYSPEDGLNKEFDAQLSDYLSERMPFRSMVLDWKATVMQNVFASSTAADVVIGKNGWLYFEPTIPEYTGTSLLSDRSIANIVETLTQISEYCESTGHPFVFTVAPNKNTLYDENMPFRFLRGEVSNYSRLRDAFADSDVPFVDFSEMDTWSQESLYYATDSHWNMRGAAMAYDSLLDSLQIDHYDYAEGKWTAGEKQTDLMRMLYPNRKQTEEELIPDVEYTYEYTSRFRSEEDINITTANESGQGSLLMFRDSFGNALLPFFAQHFSSACFTRAVPIDLTQAKDGDVIVYEIVQRNIGNIISYAPILPAKKSSLQPNETGDDGLVRLLTKPQNSLLHIYGEMDESTLAVDSKIFLQLTGEDGSHGFYRCFPISEASLYNDSVVRDNGFSCYLDISALPAGNYQASVCVQTGERIAAYPADADVVVN